MWTAGQVDPRSLCWIVERQISQPRGYRFRRRPITGCAAMIRKPSQCLNGDWVPSHHLRLLPIPTPDYATIYTSTMQMRIPGDHPGSRQKQPENAYRGLPADLSRVGGPLHDTDLPTHSYLLPAKLSYSGLFASRRISYN